MGRRTNRTRTPGLWIATNELPATGGHPFYQRLNQVLDAHGFDEFVEAECAPFYARLGRPSLLPGTYFRLLLIGYFEGIDSERGIAWRTADSLALRGFLGLGLEEATPEHSTISRTRRLIDLETHRAVFTWILQVVATADLIKGKTIGIDATTLEANAALRSIVRRDSGETYQEFLSRLAHASGIETPTRAELARLDRKRPKKGRNTDWRHPHDPDARITKMKDGRTHLAHKAEHAVDMETGAVVAVTVQGADQGDTTTIADTLTEAAEELEAVAATTDREIAVVEEAVADKGYHSNQTLRDLAQLDVRTYIAEPDRGRRTWKKNAAARDAVYANRRRIRGTRGLALLRRRSERLERPNAHLYETGGMRRTHLRGHTNILKRLLVHVGGFNLGLFMRALVGVGTPRGLQGLSAAALAFVVTLWAHLTDVWDALELPSADHRDGYVPHPRFELLPVAFANGTV
ncbi:MAG TPA: transposase [Vicinamibacterales bacterium]|nr:transposase [Vicinamibacterales bacterium]